MPTPWAWQQGPPPFVEASTLPKELKDRLWSRALWGHEIDFAIGQVVYRPGAADVLLGCRIHIPPETPLTFDHVRSATRSLRWEHPGIATTVAFPPIKSLSDFKPTDIRFVYQAPASEDDVNTWLDEVVFDKSGFLEAAHGDLRSAIDAMRREAAAIKPRSKWMFRVSYIGNTRSNQHAVMLQTAHALCDGIGLFEVLDLWLHELAKALTGRKQEYRWGEEGSRLDKALPERSAIPWQPNPNPADYPALRALALAAQLPEKEQGRFGIPMIHPNADPTYTGTVRKIFPAPFADNLKRATKANGCGIYAALVAANYLALLAVCPPSSKGELTIRPPGNFDLRGKHLIGGAEAKKDRRTWQVACSLGGGLIVCKNLERFLESKDLVKDVWVLAREVHAQVMAQAPLQATAATWVPIVAAKMAGAAATAPADPPNEKIIHASSVGLMDDSLAASYPVNSPNPVFTISEPLLSGVQPNEPPNEVGGLLYPYTWQGTLFVYVSWPEAFMGTVEEQKQRARRGEPTVLSYFEKFAELLTAMADIGAGVAKSGRTSGESDGGPGVLARSRL